MTSLHPVAAGEFGVARAKVEQHFPSRSDATPSCPTRLDKVCGEAMVKRRLVLAETRFAGLVVTFSDAQASKLSSLVVGLRICGYSLARRELSSLNKAFANRTFCEGITELVPPAEVSRSVADLTPGGQQYDANRGAPVLDLAFGKNIVVYALIILCPARP